MNTRQYFFTKYELPLFLLLNYILSWWSAPLMDGQLIPHGATLAAIIVLGLACEEKELLNYCGALPNATFLSWGSWRVRRSLSAITPLAWL